MFHTMFLSSDKAAAHQKTPQTSYFLMSYQDINFPITNPFPLTGKKVRDMTHIHVFLIQVHYIVVNKGKSLSLTFLEEMKNPLPPPFPKKPEENGGWKEC